ncbi:fungal-specific transcription factor domain-containing protein [Emericellopsis atlantica]|uniref:Fungal-specific transcription factor domain-containing protein n=1 Tax=Emericellopsis atlantica TaxID=2614577 RepID=A0A9P7ZVL9_9HYPO|nr:fungal-specific transcription factor domain-containing protein [Emericellopsis atlantica]KAG9258468.1 fungal-specific transcription factor domain-containing protein [Emericellopsis atlantica]
MAAVDLQRIISADPSVGSSSHQSAAGTWNAARSRTLQSTSCNLVPMPETVSMTEAAAENEIPSCQGCRRRKLKCSREQPTCSHCVRLASPCVYDLKKNKPGIKAGAVGSLSRRVEVLEQALLERQSNSTCSDPAPTETPENGTPNVLGVLSMLATELQKLNATRRWDSMPGLANTSRYHTAASPTGTNGSSRNNFERNSEISPRTCHAPLAKKRRRVDSCGNPNVDVSFSLDENLDSSVSSLPDATLLEEVISIYFDRVQPWIPILHETNFRQRVQNHDELPQLVVVLHAMVIAALRFVESPNLRLSATEVERICARSRRLVLLTCMDGLSVENLQALIIVAFEDIGNGEASRAWSVIGSLTRTVEYLQLSVEDDSHAKTSLLKPLPTVKRPKNWTEEEQRRRVFWTIFCLDRFCSVTTGWNTSLTSDDVQRRLPADGGTWHKEEGVTTPYFGIWDRSVAKIGNSIAFLPGNYPSPDKGQDNTASTPAATASHAKINDPDMTTVGAFAYRIEATESLSRITTYFLQQNIDFSNRQQVSDWLTRFKELDLRLVQQPTMINMDPNLTLAHVTHNTSMILLHQRIAYPDPKWSDTFKLPSFCSAETCQVAAIETATITQKYLKYTPSHYPVADQYAFCVYISARVLLVHWRHYNSELPLEFRDLVDALDEMARRWAGPILVHRATSSLAGKYAEQLRLMRKQCTEDPSLTIDVLGYSSGLARGTPSSPFFPDGGQSGTRTNMSSDNVNHSLPDSRCETHEQSGQLHLGNMPANSLATDGIHPDNLSAISHLLMDEDFMTSTI